MMCHFYCKMKFGTLLLVLLFFCINSFFVVGKEFKCGFPGTPAYGFVKPDEAAYLEGNVVMYTCHVGYILLGSPISKCKEDGSWSEDVPICDDSMTTLVTASSTATVPGYPAEFAIDRNKERCTYLQPKKPRWWRIDLGENKEYKVLSVAITMMPQDKPVSFTVYVIEIKNQIASYKRCASFSGKFGTPTVVLSCAEGKGIVGHKVHIEDYYQLDGLFEICEVEIQVEKDTGYDCGAPSRSLYSEAKKINSNVVEYDCLRGYELKGTEYRTCAKTGHWTGEPPICDPIICDELEPFENGVTQLRYSNDGPPLEGTIVIYKCNEGYKLTEFFTRNCSRDGTWSGKSPKCKAIRCPIPDGKEVGGVYRLINKTNSMGSLALLRCKGGKIEGDNPYIKCTEDGVWSEAEAECLIPARAASERRNKSRIVNQGGIIFGMVIAAVMIVIVLVGLYLYDQRRRNSKPELPSRLLEPPEPPPRPPPRKKENAFRTAFKGFLNRELPETENQNKNSWKTQSLPSNQAQINDLEGSPSAKKAQSYGDSLRENEKPDVVEVEVLAPHHFGYKGIYPTVPEEPENVALEDVVIDMAETESPKDSSAKNSGTKDYASVDYEKKRQSRLWKEQDSMESSSTAAGSSLPQDESETKDSPSPTPPQKLSESEEEDEESEKSSVQNKVDDDSLKKRDEDDRKAKEEEERKVKEDEERKAKEDEERVAKEEEERKVKEEEEERKVKEEEEERKVKEEENKAKAEAEKKKTVEPVGRRRRIRDEPPPQVDEKPVLRRLRKFQ